MEAEGDAWRDGWDKVVAGKNGKALRGAWWRLRGLPGVMEERENAAGTGWL